MSDDLPQVKLRAANSVSGAPDDPTLLQLLRVAAGGGRATYDFFSSEARARKELAELVAKGEQSWRLVDDAGQLNLAFLTPGQPAYVASGQYGSLILQTQLSPEVLQSDTTDYKEAGIATMWMVTDQTPMDVFITTVEKLGPGVAATALGPALLTLLGALKNFVTSFFSNVAEAAGEGAGEAETIASEAAEAAAEDAAIEGEVVADELALSVEFGPLAIIGIAIAGLTIVLMILAFGLAKTMTVWIRVFNASRWPLQLNLTYNYNLSIKQQPKDGLLPPPGPAPAPPGVKPACSVIYRADYLLQNDSTWKGLATVIQSPPGNGTDGLSFAIDIPDVGPNSLAVIPEGGVNPEGFYYSMEGRATGLSMEVSSSANSVGAAMGTNQNQYESPSPLDGSNGFNYEYVVLLTG